MATRNIIESDLSGEPEATSVTIGLVGTWHAVDLTSSEQDELRRLLDPYVRAGRRIGSSLTRKRTGPETTVAERETIRAWAWENGYALAEYGRIPKKIYAAYRAAHESQAEGA